MTRWPIGWVVLPQELVRPSECLAQDLFIWAPSLAPQAAIAPLGCPAQRRGRGTTGRLLKPPLPRRGRGRGPRRRGRVRVGASPHRDSRFPQPRFGFSSAASPPTTTTGGFGSVGGADSTNLGAPLPP